MKRYLVTRHEKEEENEKKSLDLKALILIMVLTISTLYVWPRSIAQSSSASAPYIDFQGTLWARDGSGPAMPSPYDAWHRFLYIDDGQATPTGSNIIIPLGLNAVIEGFELNCTESAYTNFYVDGHPCGTSEYNGGILTIYLDDSAIITIENITIVLTYDFDAQDINGYGWATLTGVSESEGAIGLYEEFTQFSDRVLITDICSRYPAVWDDPFLYDMTFRLTVESEQVYERAFLNGTVITMDDDLPVAEAVLIRDGLIIAVGSDEEISGLLGDEANVTDLQGRTLLPGFIDAHDHFLNNLFEVDSIEEAIDMSIRHGWTTITELFTSPELINELLALDAQGEIRNRVNLYLRISWQDQRWTDWYTDYLPGEMLTPMIRVAGVKMFADGTLSSGTAAFSEPYPDDPDNYGSLFFTQEELDQLVNETHDSGYQIAIHAIGDAAIEQVLNAYEAVLGDESNEQYRHRIEHVFFLRDELIQRMANKRIIASFQNHWATSDNINWYVDNLGPEKVSMLARWRDLLDSGVPSVASTDYPYCTYGATAIRGLFSSVTRIGPYWGLEPADSLLAQRLSVEEALRLITIDAAYATFQENVTGSITPGKYADFVVLSGNPLEVQPEELIDLTVWMTVVGGNIEYWREDLGTYTLSVDVEGPGRTHLAPGEYDYPSGFTLNFDALPGSPTTDNAAFSHWLLDGDNMGSMDSISVTMDSDHDLTAVFVETCELTLFEGWNLIGLPCIPEDPSIEVILSEIIDYVDCVWAFDGETKTWLSYSPWAPSDLTVMIDGRGYWIKVNTDTILTIYCDS